jgi:3-deoxy-D-manno-octulosonic acid (KDO) 8-phosphate synthase
MRVVYVSEQSATSLAMQMREVGFTGLEPVEELMIVPREQWCRFTYIEMLAEVEELFLINGNCNAIIFDTWHAISCLEGEKPRGGSERNRRVEVCVGSLKVMPE